MAILELRGFKVLPLLDLDDGEFFVDWPGGGATTAVRWGGERGFGWGHGRRRQAALPLVTGSLGKISNSVIRKAQDGHQAIRHRSNNTKIK